MCNHMTAGCLTVRGSCTALRKPVHRIVLYRTDTRVSQLVTRHRPMPGCVGWGHLYLRRSHAPLEQLQPCGGGTVPSAGAADRHLPHDGQHTEAHRGGVQSVDREPHRSACGVPPWTALLGTPHASAACSHVHTSTYVYTHLRAPTHAHGRTGKGTLPLRH